jgi:hypothetical protein
MPTVNGETGVSGAMEATVVVAGASVWDTQPEARRSSPGRRDVPMATDTCDIEALRMTENRSLILADSQQTR